METKKLSLPEVLSILEASQSESTEPLFFVNECGNLETFFTYKGTLIELNKFSLKIQIGKATSKEVGEDIRSILVDGLKKGYWLVFFVGASSSFNYVEFFKQFDFSKGDTNFFNSKKLREKSYLKSSGILKDEDDKDNFGNQGYYKVHDDAKVFFLCNCPENEIQNIKENNNGINFDFYVIS